MHTPSPFVFISYSSTDSAIARRLAAKLDLANIRYFLDRKRIDLGDNFKTKISHGLRQATDLVLIASPGSLESHWVIFEVGQAVAFGCRILPLLTHPKLKLPSFLSDLQHENSADRLVKYLQARTEAAKAPKSLAVSHSAAGPAGSTIAVQPTLRLTEFLRSAPPDWYSGNIAIDGAVELYTFPDQGNRYGGVDSRHVTVNVTDHEWSELALRALSPEKLAVLGTELNTWVGTRKRKPNRIRYLVAPPKQIVLDNTEFQMTIGNSDYFTMRTVTELSRKSHLSSNGGPIAEVFDSWWAKPGRDFDATTVPYHISALGVLFITDPNTDIRYLILTLPDSRRTPLVAGWNASFAEQMWAPSASIGSKPWWSRFAKNLNIDNPIERTGDRHIWSTVTRGLHEELGISETDLSSEPRLVMACMEQDMHFIGFVFVLQARLTLDEFQKRRLGSPDSEIGTVAAYPVDGPTPKGGQYDASVQLAKLLEFDEFDGGPFLVPSPGSSLKSGWHISSRLRIHAAARHIEGNRFQDYVQPTTPRTDA